MLDPLELELQAVVSHLIQALGTKPWSSARAVRALDHRTIFPAPRIIFNEKQMFSDTVLASGRQDVVCWGLHFHKECSKCGEESLFCSDPLSECGTLELLWQPSYDVGAPQ